jgi:hypothetical protein
MTYQVQKSAQAIDFNSIINTNTPSVNGLWATGSGDSGYGQDAIHGVVTGKKITALSSTDGSNTYGGWSDIARAIATMAVHQGTSITTIPLSQAKEKIDVKRSGSVVDSIATDLALLNTNRLNAIQQASSTLYKETSSSSWSDYIKFKYTIDFGSDDRARWFFNAGGQFKVSLDHPLSRGMNQLVNYLGNAMGEVWISSPDSTQQAVIVGTTWNGVTKVGGSQDAYMTLNTGYGFNYLRTVPNTDVELIRQKYDNSAGGYSYRGFADNSYAGIVANYDNTTGKLYITALFDEIPGSGPSSSPVTAGTIAMLIVRPPSGANLSNTNWVGSWGVWPAVSCQQIPA